MSSRAAAVFVAVVLIASALAGYGAISHVGGASSSPTAVTTVAGPTPPSAAVHPAVTSILIETVNGYGDPTTTFCTGSCISFAGGGYPGGSILSFSLADPMADLFVNVTINDQNATRDGLTNPVFSATLGINQTTHDNITEVNQHLSYSFPAALVLGGTWNLTASAPLGGTAVSNLTIVTYVLQTYSQPTSGSVTVPGESIDVSWIASLSGNGATYTHLTSLTATGSFTNVTAMDLFAPGLKPLPVVGAGSWSIQIPDNATYDTEVTLQIWAVTNSSGYISGNSTSELTFWVGEPRIENMVSSSNTECNDHTNTFTSGSFAFVCLYTEAHAAGHGDSEVGGLLVQINFWNGVANVTPPDGPGSSLTTTSNGEVQFSFQANAPPFSSYYVYPYGNFVNVSVSDPLATTPGYLVVYENYSFEVLPPATAGVVTVILNAIDYDVGQTVFANWSLSSSNSTQVGPLAASLWALADDYGTVLLTGPISGTAQTGMVEFSLPAGYVGEFVVGVLATNATASFIGVSTGLAEQPTLLVSQPFGYYTPGQTMLFPVEVTPNVLPGTTIYYNITGLWYSNELGTTFSVAVVAVGTVASGGSIAYTVPSTAPGNYYEYDVWAQSPSAGVYASDDGEVELATGFTVQVGITTQSSYSDGSFQPGQTIQVSWSLTPLGTTPVPSYLYVELYFGDTDTGPFWATTSTSGTQSLTIPSNTPSGFYYIDIDVDGNYLYGPDCYYGDYCYGDSGLTVNAHPSALNMELGAGSGITVGWLILLIVILVVAVLLVLMIRRGRSPKYPPSNYTATSGTMSSPAPAPSSPGATEWKEPSTTSTPPPAADAPPPLPTPPSGPQ